ncbi:BTAD domain-containing putative transcriptional regulator [Streptomyces sp. NPDC052236]|uniref:AfsR/SARP family transcriptional regulator n=1 Tax=Streptomyces sp. NPDC052236 TaxID=3365686 RepID=UPI0037D159D5
MAEAAAHGNGMRFELLGPLRALRADGDEIELGPPKQRAVLAVLLHQDGRSMSYDALVDAVWGVDTPTHVRNLVQKYVSGLRRAFTGGPAPELVWTGSGYRLSGAAIDDMRERHALLRAALAARDSGDLRRAGELAARGEALWRGEFAEGLTGPYLQAERRRWAEKRLLVLESRLEGDIQLGRYHECVHELMRQVAAHPLRERLVWLLMLALYRSGRSSDALLAYEEARGRIAEVMGADPGPELRALHQRLLRQDPALSPGSVPGSVPGDVPRGVPAA